MWLLRANHYVLSFCALFPIAGALNFLSINGSGRPGAIWIVSWEAFRDDPDTFFLCLGYSGPNALFNDFSPFSSVYNCSKDKVITDDGTARFSLPTIQTDYYSFFATNVSSGKLDFANIFGTSNAVLILMDSDATADGTVSTDFLRPKKTSGIGKTDLRDFTSTSTSSSATPTVFPGSLTVSPVATTGAGAHPNGQNISINRTTLQIVAGVSSAVVGSIMILTFFLLHRRRNKRRKDKKREVTPYPTDLTPDEMPINGTKAGLRLVTLEDQLRLLQQQIADMNALSPSGVARGSNDIGRNTPTRSSDHANTGDVRASARGVVALTRLHSVTLSSPPPTYTNAGGSTSGNSR